jgi:hypothetical protein
MKPLSVLTDKDSIDRLVNWLTFHRPNEPKRTYVTRMSAQELREVIGATAPAADSGGPVTVIYRGWSFTSKPEAGAP